MSVDVTSVSRRGPDVPGVTLGRRLGAGGASVVWSGLDVRTGEPVAVKVLTVCPERAAAALREATLLARLDHEHLVRLLRAEPVAGGVALVLEQAPGGSLAALVGARRALDPGEVVTVLVPIATALAHLHDRGAVHGDVAPGNVLFAADGRPLLADLGVASLVGLGDRTHATPGFTDALERLGTTPTPAGDVFGLGAVAWFGLTGRVPPSAGERPPLAPFVPGCPPALVDLVERCLDPRADRRPAAVDVARLAYAALAPEPVRLVPAEDGVDGVHVITHRLRREAIAVPPDQAPWRNVLRRRASGVAGALPRFVAAVVRLLPRLLRPVRGLLRRRRGAHRAAGRTRPWVTAVAAVGVLTVLAVLAGAVAEPVTAGPAPVAAPRDDVLVAVEAASAARAQAFSTGSAASLATADEEGSAARAADDAVLADLTTRGVALRGLVLRLDDVRVVQRDDAAATVELITTTGAHDVVRVADGAVLQSVPESAPRSVRLGLVRRDGVWRVATVG